MEAAEAHRKGHSISFNVSSIPQDERLVSAELRLLWSPSAPLGSGAHQLSLYLSEGEARPGAAGPLETRLLSSGPGRRTEGSWESFSLDAELLRRALAQGPTLGFVLETVPDDGSGSPPQSPAEEPGKGGGPGRGP